MRFPILLTAVIGLSSCTITLYPKKSALESQLQRNIDQVCIEAASLLPAIDSSLAIIIYDTEKTNDWQESKTARFLINKLTANIRSNKKAVIIKQKHIDQIIKDQGFQFSGLFDSDSAARVGRLADTHYLLVGKLQEEGESFHLTLRLLEVESNEWIWAYESVLRNYRAIRRFTGDPQKKYRGVIVHTGSRTIKVTTTPDGRWLPWTTLKPGGKYAYLLMPAGYHTIRITTGKLSDAPYFGVRINDQQNDWIIDNEPVDFVWYLSENGARYVE